MSKSTTSVTPESEFAYEPRADGTARITGYTGKGKRVVCPDKIDGHSVTELGMFAFSRCA